MANQMEEFCIYLEEQVKNGSIYVWGGQGQTASDSLIDQRETSAANKRRAKALLKTRIEKGYQTSQIKAFDCSGLGMYYLYNLQGIEKSDLTAQGMKGKCEIISKAKLKKGDWVFRVYQSGSNAGKAYHIGFVVDDALHVIEAKGRDDGVIKRTLNAGGSSYWNAFGRYRLFQEEIEGAKQEAQVPQTESMPFLRLLKKTTPSMQGDDVAELQKLLKTAGMSPGSMDGIFGTDTKKAVQLFQKANSLKVDGIAGKETITALGGKWMDTPQVEEWTTSRLLKKTDPMMRGEDVKALQTALFLQGYRSGSAGVDGIFGEDTQMAVRKFQKEKKLAVDGIAGKETITALGGVWRG